MGRNFSIWGKTGHHQALGTAKSNGHLPDGLGIRSLLNAKLVYLNCHLFVDGLVQAADVIFRDFSRFEGEPADVPGIH